MMTRSAKPDVFSIRGFTALATCVVALGAFFAGGSSPPGERGPVSGLLHRAQAEADAHRFNLLLGAIEGQPVLRKSAIADKSAPSAESHVVKPKSDVVSTSGTTKLGESILPPKPILKTVALETPKPQQKADAPRVHAVTKKVQNSWRRIGRDWAGLAGNGF